MLYINGRFLTQKETGVQNYARQICRELKEQNIEFILLVPERSELINDEFTESIVTIGQRTGHLWEQIELFFFIRSNKNNLLLNLCNTGPILLKNQQIATVHDLAFLKNEKWFGTVFRKWYAFMIPRLIKQSKSIITVSHFIKNEIQGQFNTSSDKIEVIPNKLCGFPVVQSSFEKEFKDIEPKSYFLMVGSDNPRKNFAFVEKIFSNELRDEQLLIVGGKNNHFNSDKKHIEAHNITRLGYTTTEQLMLLYMHCKAVIHPSLYEGFGIPILESFSFNCPVVCSDIPVFREVCEDAAIYFDPEDEREFLIAIKQLNNDNTYLVERGKERLAFYQKIDRVSQLKKIIIE